MKDESWRAKAECLYADPDLFFPPPGGNGIYALRVCERCEVKRECLEYAIDNRIEEGVWGGTSGRIRDRVMKWSMEGVA